MCLLYCTYVISDWETSFSKPLRHLLNSELILCVIVSLYYRKMNQERK